MAFIREISEQMREYFVSDYSLPIQVIEGTYFQYFIDLLDPYYGSIKKYLTLIDTLEKVGDEQILMQRISQFRNEAIHDIESNGSYQGFVHDLKMPDPVVPLTKGTLYQEANVNKTFASIDLVQANFQSLKYICNGLFRDCECYEDFAKKYTDLEYIIKSKKIRQIIFGQLCPARQQTIQRYIISVIKQFLMDVQGVDVISTSSDEILFQTEMTESDIKTLLCHEDSDKCKAKSLDGIRLRINTFKLTMEGTDKFKFFLKTYSDGRKEIKQVDSAYIPEVIKFLEGKPITDFDRIFVKDGRMCQFRDSLF